MYVEAFLLNQALLALSPWGVQSPGFDVVFTF